MCRHMHYGKMTERMKKTEDDIRINVYDFDGTIYNGDCTLDFWKWIVKRYPLIIFTLPKSIVYGIAFKLGIIERERFKEKFYQFLKFVPDIDMQIRDFWNHNQSKINKWYLNQMSEDDLVISASPEFLIKPICNRLGVHCIASLVNKQTGKLLGKNCRGQEKVVRFCDEFKDMNINEFYSDSVSDLSMARLAEKAFFVKHGKITVWNKN